jgi:uroporphyrinogen-III decarboxylase
VSGAGEGLNMNRQFYLDLAAAGLRMPIGTHVVLHGHADPKAIELDGRRLGAVVLETAERFGTPLAVPLMDLTLEKAALLLACGVPEAEVDIHHFVVSPPAPEKIPLTPRMRASCEAIAHVAARPDVVPIGMAIGPFSLTTKLMADPITPVYLAGTGLSADKDPEVALLERLLSLSELTVHRYLWAQIEAGARAVIIWEPAANLAFFSPKKLATNPALFERFVMEPMQRIARMLVASGVDLLFHDCGELTTDMVRRFATLGAAILSFGSSRRLWEDAALVPKDTVLYGNLPTKRFCASELMAGEVECLAQDLVNKMHAVGHPFILGSECDVLSVPGKEAEILGKVDAFMRCPCYV